MKRTTLNARSLRTGVMIAGLVLAHGASAAGMHAEEHVHGDGAAVAKQAAPSVSSSASAGMTDGEVRKVDKDAGKLTLRHGPIQNLDMPGMTMVFRVADKSRLDTLKAGDRVRFKAESDNGQLVVTEIRPLD
jgi:Cu/Ag efflux protein CusF